LLVQAIAIRPDGRLSMALRLIPNVFVISSTNGKEIAKAIAGRLTADEAIRVHVWPTEFKPNDYFMESLQSATLRFDFGIAVITPDDLTKIVREGKEAEVVEPRDNVVFELGLFLSALGRDHVLEVAVHMDGRTPSLPTDLGSISRYKLSIDSQKALEPQVKDECERMRAHIVENYSKPDLGLLPSTALAIGYFENFIKPVKESLRESNICLVGPLGTTRERRTVDRRKWDISVCIPQDLKMATREAWANKSRDLNLTPGEIELPKDSDLPRAYPFRVDARLGDGAVHIFDTPTTLKTVLETVRKLMPKASDDDYRLADARGIADFCHALQRLVADGELSEKVRIVDWEELQVCH
jgi:predicted nucleotide-binding protein